MCFEAKSASSIELCVADWVSGSRYRGETTIFAERGGAPLLDVEIFRLAPARHFASWHLAFTIRQEVRKRGYQLIVAQQHIPTVARIAAFNPNVPVILQTHNFIDAPRRGRWTRAQNRLRSWELQQLSGITLVSEATLHRFESNWPQITTPRKVITNAFDFSGWHPAAQRQNLVIVVGRTHETKGILEAAQGVSGFLGGFPQWRAVFVLSAVAPNQSYFESVVTALKPVQSQTEVLVDAPFARVRALAENAAISIVASKWEEPFGRTALEAHAGGAALISSKTGGLSEISGDAALGLGDVTGPAIASALVQLASDERLRERLAKQGMDRVRRLFPLTRSIDQGAVDAMPICERLDEFYDVVVRQHGDKSHAGKHGLRRAI
jgi:glycosyltransferase involved in cell wall biosynthesis